MTHIEMLEDVIEELVASERAIVKAKGVFAIRIQARIMDLQRKVKVMKPKVAQNHSMDDTIEVLSRVIRDFAEYRGRYKPRKPRVGTNKMPIR